MFGAATPGWKVGALWTGFGAADGGLAAAAEEPAEDLEGSTGFEEDPVLLLRGSVIFLYYSLFFLSEGLISNRHTQESLRKSLGANENIQGK